MYILRNVYHSFSFFFFNIKTKNIHFIHLHLNVIFFLKKIILIIDAFLLKNYKRNFSPRSKNFRIIVLKSVDIVFHVFSSIDSCSKILSELYLGAGMQQKTTNAPPGFHNIPNQMNNYNIGISRSGNFTVRKYFAN